MKLIRDVFSNEEAFIRNKARAGYFIAEQVAQGVLSSFSHRHVVQGVIEKNLFKRLVLQWLLALQHRNES